MGPGREDTHSPDRINDLRADIKVTKDEVAAQLTKVQELARVQHLGEAAVAKEAAILDALTSRLLGYRLQLASAELQGTVVTATTKLTAASIALGLQIDEAADKADNGTRLLAKWTMCLVFATFFLGVVALIVGLVQAWITWSAAPPFVVVPIPKP